jgi:hypothetical protein
MGSRGVWSLCERWPPGERVSFPSRDTDRNERFGLGKHNPDQ